MFRRLQEEHAEFFVKRLHRYCGAKSLSDLKTIVLDSLLMSSSTVCQPNFAISGLLEVSKLLFVMILAARFCNFCSWLMSVDPAQPQTEQQYRKWGSTIPVSSELNKRNHKCTLIILGKGMLFGNFGRRDVKIRYFL